MGTNRVLLFIGIIFFVQMAWSQGRLTDEALSNMEKAFAEAEAGAEAEFTAQDEYYLGRATAAVILAYYRPYSGNRELTNYVNKICRTLAINSPQPDIYNGYHVIILDSPEYNAFATPGGHILITKALIEAAPSEDALAGIIAHELAHIQLRHGMSIIVNMKLNDQITAMADRAAELAGKDSPAVKSAVEFRSSVNALFDTMLLDGYSQIQEFEADREAARLLAAANYNPGAYVEMLKVLQRVQRSREGGFNNTHPSPEQRIANMAGVISHTYYRDTFSYRSARFRKITGNR